MSLGRCFEKSGAVNFAISGGTQRYQAARGSVEVIFGASKDRAVAMAVCTLVPA